MRVIWPSGASRTDIAEIVVVHKESVGPIFDSFVSTVGSTLPMSRRPAWRDPANSRSSRPTSSRARPATPRRSTPPDLPAGLQIDVLERAAALTIESQGGAKSWWGSSSN